MYSIKNKVQLIGFLGNAPEIKTIDSGKKIAKFSLATHETHLDAQGEKVKETQWHNLVAFGKNAEFAEKYLSKGRELVVDGKLASHSYTAKDGSQKTISEIQVNEIVLLGERVKAENK